MSDEKSYKVVNVGVDSLWLNYCYGVGEDLEAMQPERRPLDEMVVEKLTALQAQAKVAEKPIPTEYSFNDAVLMMYGNGGGMKSSWRFILRNDFIEVKIGLGKRNGVLAKVRLSASFLWAERDIHYCILCADVLMLALLNAPLYSQVSGVDLCADVTGYDFSTSQWQEGFIRRSGLQPHFGDFDPDTSEDENYVPGPDKVHMRYRPITGFTFGSHASAMSAVVYNKSSYIKHKKPETAYFHDLWHEQGWDGTAEVWRVEFRLRRDALHAMSIESAYELPNRLAAMWEYCAINWLRYVVPENDTNRSRWAMHPVWTIVTQAFLPTLTPEQIELGPVVREHKRVVNKERMISQITGCLITLHAWDKDDELCEHDDLSLVLHRYYANAEDYLARRGREFNHEVRYKQRLYSLVAA